MENDKTFKVYGYYQVSCICYLGSIPNFENYFYKYI